MVRDNEDHAAVGDAAALRLLSRRDKSLPVHRRDDCDLVVRDNEDHAAVGDAAGTGGQRIVERRLRLRGP